MMGFSLEAKRLLAVSCRLLQQESRHLSVHLNKQRPDRACQCHAGCSSMASGSPVPNEWAETAMSGSAVDAQSTEKSYETFDLSSRCEVLAGYPNAWLSGLFEIRQVNQQEGLTRQGSQCASNAPPEHVRLLKDLSSQKACYLA